MKHIVTTAATPRTPRAPRRRWTVRRISAVIATGVALVDLLRRVVELAAELRAL